MQTNHERVEASKDTAIVRVPEAGSTELVARFQDSQVLRRAAVEQRRRFDEARSSLRATAKRHQDAVRQLDRARTRSTELQSGRGALLFKAAGVAVFEFWIELPGFSGPIDGAAARVEQNGDVHQVSDVSNKTKSGLGGAVVGGLLLGPVGAVAGLAATRKNKITTTVKTVDTRQFELEVRGPGFAWSTVLGPSSAADLRKLRDLVNARGSCGLSVRDAITTHAQILSERSDAASQLHAETESNNATLARRHRKLDAAVARYTAARLPFVGYVKARWMQSTAFQRLLLVAGSPFAMVAWFVRHCTEGFVFSRKG